MSNALMSIEAEVARLAREASQLDGESAVAPAMDAGMSAPGGQRFAESLERALYAVDAQGREAETKVTAVEAGRSDDLVGAMLSSQQASLSFSMLMQVRNKVASAFDDLIKLQV